MQKSRKLLKYRIMAAGLVALVLLTLGYLFVFQAREGLYQEKVNYLEELSLKSAGQIRAQIGGCIGTVNAIATFIGGEENFNPERSMPILVQEATRNSFKRMGVILPDGTAYTTDDLVFDMGDRDYFHQAMAGESAVSGCLVDKADGGEINVIAAPIHQGEQVVGVAFATRSQQDFSRALAIESFHGQGYSYVITSQGKPVVKTTHPNSIGDYDNLFDSMLQSGLDSEWVIKMQEDVAQGQSGAFAYDRDGEPRQLCYSPVGVNDWYIISAVPSDIISRQSNRLLRNLTVLAGLIVVGTILTSWLMIAYFQRNNRRLQVVAYTDAVTGHANWPRFMLEAKELLENAAGQPYAMILFDINKFKVINDMFGHDHGNQVLRYVAEVVKKNTGDKEAFARVSADNFNILMQYESDDKTIRRLEKICREVEDRIAGYKIELSIGVYPINEHILDISVLSDRANISKNIAKKQNDGNVHFFKEENRMEIIREKEIENLMEAALENREFEVYLQPKYLLSTEQIVGAEALVRWNRKDSGIVFPGEFIPLFEKNGFVRKLDFYMFEQVCGLIAGWKQTLPQECIVPISINISRVHLSDKDLAQELLAVARDYQIDPQLLEIELTESAVFLDVDNMVEIMKKIKAAGFKLSIDDFGSGYSSLSALKNLPADFVKIDKSFLDEAINDRRGEKIIGSIVAMTGGLGLSTVAEGVETGQQAELLKEMGCNIAQGYHYARPMPVDAFEKLISGNRPD